MGVSRLSVVESQKMYGNRRVQMAELKSLIRKILGEKSGDFDHIMRELSQIKGLPEYDVLRSQALAVLRNWRGLKIEKRKHGEGVEKYSLGQEN